jgi:hypothetical protein
VVALYFRQEAFRAADLVAQLLERQLIALARIAYARSKLLDAVGRGASGCGGQDIVSE